MWIARPLLAFLLITVHLLNVVGYYSLWSHLEIAHNRRITESLNADAYAGSDAITLRIPLSLPYPSAEQTNYERVDGKFNHGGVTYRTVKQKFYNDTLYVVCVRDWRGTQIVNALQELAASMGDQTPIKAPSSKIAGLFVKDLAIAITLTLTSQRFALNVTEIVYITPLYASAFPVVIAPPPQHGCCLS